MYSKIWILTLLLPVALFSSADVYRCKMVDGIWLYTDRLCTDGAGEQIELSKPMTGKNLAPAGLSEAELRALTKLDQRLARSRHVRIKDRKKLARQISRDNKVRQRSCALAALQLEDLKNLRSHGYKLAEAHKLDQQDRQLQALKKANCR